MTEPGGDDHPFESTDERDHERERPVTMRSVERTAEEADYWSDDRERWLRENVPPHHN